MIKKLSLYKCIYFLKIYNELKAAAATLKAQVKRLANTGSGINNTAAGFGVLLVGITTAIRKCRNQDKNIKVSS